MHQNRFASPIRGQRRTKQYLSRDAVMLQHFIHDSIQSQIEFLVAIVVRQHVVSLTKGNRVRGWRFGLVACVVLTGCNNAQRPSDVVPFEGSWTYRWGDSPRLSDGTLAWLRPGEDGAAWQSMAGMGSPPGRNGNQFLWVRTKINGPEVPDPVLYLRGVDQIFEAYLDGNPVYHFGAFEGPEALKFLGYKAHYIPLGKQPEGKTLTFRIYSNHVNIGLFGETLVGRQLSLVTEVTRRDLPTLAMGIITLSIGSFVFFLFLARRQERGYLNYGLLALTTGAYFLAVSPSRQLIVDAPLGWLHAELFSLYLMGGFLATYVEQLFGAGFRGMVRWLKRALFAYAALAVVVVVADVVPVLQTLLPNQVLLLLTAILLSIHTARAAWRGLPDARTFAVGFITVASAGAYDLLGAMGVLSRSNLPIGHLGFFVFTLAMGLILARRFVHVQDRLGQYSTVLGLSLASARVLEPGQQAQVALDELLRLLKAQRALLFLVEPKGSEQVGQLELRAAREVHAGMSVPMNQTEGAPALRWEVIERVQAERKPLITSSMENKKRRNAMAAPLVVRDELVGVLYLEGAGDRQPFDEADLAILLGLGTQLSITIVTTRAVRLELQTAIQKNRLEKQDALLAAASRMAKGDVETPIVVDADSELADLGLALDEMRQDVRSKIKMLETKNAEVHMLNEELRRKIEARTMTLLSALVSDGNKSSVPRLQPGAKIGDRYQLGKKLGAGAMGVVYAAERTSDGKPLAIKVLLEVTDKPSIARFIREAHLLARLGHPNLVSIFDVDITPEGHLYLVMEFFDGQTLDKHKNKPVGWSLSVLQQIAEGLDAVHASGIVHRDLKPANILVALDSNGRPRVKLVDFGVSTLAREGESNEPLAREPLLSYGDDKETIIIAPPNAANAAASKTPSNNEKFQVTQTGALVGTPSYMAPELAPSQRKAHDVSPSSDLFGVGVVAYEMLTGTRPFAVPPVFLFAANARLDLPLGLRNVPGLSRPLVQMLERCLSHRPNDRPSARTLADTLRGELSQSMS